MMEAENYSINSVTNGTCQLSEYWQKFSDTTWFLSYYIIFSLHLIFGLPAITVYILVFYKQTKREDGFMYQLVMAINNMVYLFANALYVVMLHWCSGLSSSGDMWFKKSYSLMWIAGHLATPFINFCLINSVLFLLCISGDRLFALIFPLKYKNINYKRHQVVAFITCVLISLITNVPDVWICAVEQENDFYILSFSDSCGIACSVMGHLRDGLLMGGPLLLIVWNSIIVHLYRKRNKKVNQMTSHNDAQEAKRKIYEKTLIILTIYESVLCVASSLIPVGYYIAAFISPWFQECGILAFQAVLDGMSELLDLLMYYLLFAVSKHFRDLLFDTFPRLKCQN